MRTIAPTQAQVVVLGSQASNGEVVTGAAAQAPSSQQYSTSTNSIVTSDGDAGTIAAGRKAIIQNLDDAAVYVKYGTGASTSDFTFMLAAGTAANNGTGGSYVIDDFAGIVSILAAAGSPRVNFALLS